MIRIGVDFGGTKIEAAALAPDGAWLARRRIANPNSYDAAVAAVAELVAEMEKTVGTAMSVGIGAPGSVSPVTGTMRNANSVWLNGRPFCEDLDAALGRPVKLANDADCLALSEAADGAAAGARAAFAVIIGTGCGGGLAVDGRLVAGPSGVAGEWGHTPLPWPCRDEIPGPECWCGLAGCLETWVSGSGFARDYAEATGATAAAEAIVAAARAGEPAAAACLERWLDRLGRGLAVIVNILDPEVIVFGGGMSLVGELYDALPDRVAPYVFGGYWAGRAAPARWGDASGVRGAARLWDT